MPVSGALIDGLAGAIGLAVRRRRRRRWPGRPPPSPAGGDAATPRRRSAPGPRLAEHEAGAAGLDLELGQVGAIEQGREPVDEAEQLEIVVVAGRRTGRARRSAAASTDVACASSASTTPSGSGSAPDHRLGSRSSVMRPTAGRRGGVLPAEPERVRQRDPDVVPSRLVRRRSSVRAASGSGSVRLMVGGMQPSRMVMTVAIASIAPAAPSVWPIIDLLAVIGVRRRGRRRSS